MDLSYPITLKDLASISKEAREFFQKMVTRRRVASEARPPRVFEQKLIKLVELLNDKERENCLSALHLLAQEENAVLSAEDEDEDPRSDTVECNFLAMEDLPQAQFYISDGTDGLLKGSRVHRDPVEQYLQSLAPGDAPKPIVVARPTSSLRTLFPEINSVGIEETLLDDGSQICTIEEDTAEMMDLKWSPDVVINLQSMNLTTNPSLGLARNIPFRFGDTIAYLQLHVVKNVAYKVLLGRPFHVVMSTEVKNMRDGSQKLTLTDPNTGLRVTCPTYERGNPPAHIKKRLWEQEERLFQDSMN